MLRQEIAPTATAPYPTGKACFRWLVPVARLREIESTKDMVRDPGVFIEWAAEDRRLVAYPCSNNTVYNLCAFVPSAEAGVQADGGEPFIFVLLLSLILLGYQLSNSTNRMASCWKQAGS